VVCGLDKGTGCETEIREKGERFRSPFLMWEGMTIEH